MKKILYPFFICFLFTTHLFCQSFDWCYSINGYPYANVETGIATDTNGNVYTTGWFGGTIDVDPGPGIFNLTGVGASGSSASFLTKTDSLKNLVWAFSFNHAISRAVNIDNNQNVTIVGTFSDTMDAEPGSGIFNLIGATTNADDFIIKLDQYGNLIFAKAFGNNINDWIGDVASDSYGNTYVTGSFTDTLDIDPGTGVYNLNGNGSGNRFLLKLNAFGDFVWAFGFNSPITGSGKIEVDQSGDIFLNGSCSSNAMDMDPDTAVTVNIYLSGGRDFIAKYDSSGDFKWVRQYNGLTFDLSLDHNINLLITGIFSGTVDFDPGPGVDSLTGNGSNEIFILKLDSAGNYLWANSFGSTDLDNGYAVQADHNNNVYAMGFFMDTVDFDPGPGIFNLTSSTPTGGVYILKLNEAGNFINALQIVPINILNTYSFAIDRSDNVYASGLFQGMVDFNPGAGYYFMNAPTTNTYVLKLKPDTCSDLTIVMDSVVDNLCNQPGYALAHGINGNPPYSYSWNTIPVINDSVLTVTTGGIYTVTITDNIGCSRTSGVLINEPHYFSQFDLEVNLTATTFVPGLNTKLSANGFNNGCVPVSGTLNIILDTSVTYLYAIPLPDSVAGDTLTWAFNNLTYDSLHIMPAVFVKTDSTVMNGDALCFDVSILPIAGDADSTNNQKHYCFNARTSYDPNEKQVYPTGSCDDKYVLKDEWLTYAIHFQNTGTAPAINIVILDSLSPALNINSIKVVGSSHPVFTEILTGNRLRFRFDQINLPDSGANNAESNGYVFFKILPDSSIPDGTPVKNSSLIIFDYNSPVLTNTVQNKVVAAIPLPDTSITQNNTTLTANAIGVTYQWINCTNNYAIIPGATSQSFTATVPGSYAVILIENGCIDTSACIYITNTAIAENETNRNIYLYPNPARDQLKIYNYDFMKIENIVIYNSLGVQLKSFAATRSFSIAELHEGIYVVQIKTKDNGVVRQTFVRY